MNKNVTKCVFNLLLLILIVGCIQKNENYEEKSLKRDTILTMLSDSSFFSNNIQEINCDENGVYFSDYDEANLIVLNDSLVLKRKIAKKSEAPTDLVVASRFLICDSIFFILDEGANSIKEYTVSNIYKRTTHLPANIAYAPWCRFVYEDSLF